MAPFFFSMFYILVLSYCFGFFLIISNHTSDHYLLMGQISGVRCITVINGTHIVYYMKVLQL